MPAVNLGVLTDFSQVPARAVVTLGVTEECKQKLRETVRGVFGERAIRNAQATKLFGKARFVLCPIFGRVGLGILHSHCGMSRAAGLCCQDPMCSILFQLCSRWSTGSVQWISLSSDDATGPSSSFPMRRSTWWA